MAKILIIDANNIAYRAYYTGNMRERFIHMCKTARKLIKPTQTYYVFDSDEKNIRYDLYSDYKKDRNSDENRSSQVTKLYEEVKSYKPTTTFRCSEADDGIAFLTKKLNCDITILSSDKDMWGLINDTVKVLWFGHKNFSKTLEIIDANKVKEKLGVFPHQVYDYKALMGDPSDGIKGAKGIGKVGAAKLISEFDNIDNVYKNLENISTSLRKKLIESKANVYLSKQLVSPIEVEL